MTVVLPFTNTVQPVHRILTCPTWQGGNATWTAQPMWSTSSPGFDVMSYSRCCLPMAGECRLRYRYGKINGKLFSLATSGATSSPGSTNSTAMNTPDMRGLEIRVQAANGAYSVAQGGSGVPLWRTVWWGQCLYQEDIGWGASAIPAGEVNYYCFDGLYRTRYWYLNRHIFYVATPSGALYDSTAQSYGAATSQGHPGYNTTNQDGFKRGNLDPSGYTMDPNGDGLTGTAIPVLAHCFPGAGSYWTDLQAINHSLLIVRPFQEPVFQLAGPALSYYSQAIEGSVWPVAESETVWSFLNTICRRQRGLGVAFLDWADDTPSPTGPLQPKITVMPQTLADISFPIPTGTGSMTGWANVTLQGAENAGTAIALDLQGDHRLVEGSLKVAERDTVRYDRVESFGERIECLATLSLYDASQGAAQSFCPRWIPAALTQFAALPRNQRFNEAYRDICQRYGIPHGFLGQVADHNAGKTVAPHWINYQCDDTGYIYANQSQTAGITSAQAALGASPLLWEFLPTLPLLEGYNYASYPPVRYDGQTETGTPPRRPPFVLLRTTQDNTYYTGEQLVNPAGIHIARDSLWVICPSDLQPYDVTRTIGDITNAGLGSVYSYLDIGVTVGLRLPTYMRMATNVQAAGSNTSPAYATTVPSAFTANPRKTKTIRHQGLHLWVASPGAIWDVNASLANAQTAFPGVRGAGSGTSGSFSGGGVCGILRDDRAALASRHFLASAWYLVGHTPIAWQLRDCGSLPAFATTTGPVAFPRLGQVVATLSANGQTGMTPNTPITSMHVDNRQEGCITSWQTDWSELDFVDEGVSTHTYT